MEHKFAVGQNVDFSPGMTRGAASGPYEICRLMPEGDSAIPNPRYRIKSSAERHERVASETDLTLWDSPEHLAPRY